MKKVLLCLFCFLFYFCIEDVKAVKGQNVSIASDDSTVLLLPWKEADKIFSKYSKFTVMDVETGKRFVVQRRAGSQHADVQPLTAKDTKIMKEIYNGKWSWKRRAIILILDKKQYAASMHGMPHGAGALDNEFPGHFCIHFLGSTTHKTDKMDFSHKLMVFKAAGQLEEVLDSFEPDEVVQAFVAGLKEQDLSILSHLSLTNDWEELNQIENVKLIQVKLNEMADVRMETELTAEVEWEIYRKQQSSLHETRSIQLFRISPLEPWRIRVNESLF